MANWLSDLRDHKELTQDQVVQQLAEHGIEITRAALSHWENGRNDPPLGNQVFRNALSKVLGVTPEHILRVSGYGVASEHSYDTDAIRAAEIITHLDPKMRRLALGVLEQFTTS